MKRTIKVLGVSALILSIVLCVVVITHFRSTGLTPHYYVRTAASELRLIRLPGTYWLAANLETVFLDSGFFADRTELYPPDLQPILPIWRGNGANPLRREVAPRYTRDGRPIALADENLWLLASPPALVKERVASVAELRAAVIAAKPGTHIELEPGRYRIREPIILPDGGRADAPLVLASSLLGDAIFEFSAGAHFDVEGPYWHLANLVIRGVCEKKCNAPIKAQSGAAYLTLRNVFASSTALLVETGNAKGGLLEGITTVNTFALPAGSDWRLVAARSVRGLKGPPDVVVCAEERSAHDCGYTDFNNALKSAPPGGLVLMRNGVFLNGSYVKTPDLHIIAEPGAQIIGGAVQGKGAIIVDANVTIEGLECSQVRVGDGNGTCLRQQSGNVTLRGVHFHDAQMGILAGHNGGVMHIEDSYFHDNGMDGQSHNIYVNSGELKFINSWSLMARGGGHELKSRASRTLIQNSFIASINARDSRLIDTPNAGLLEIYGSVLGEGPRSENWDVIGYGLELRNKPSPHPVNRIIMKRNTIYLDRPQGAEPLHQQRAGEVNLNGNITVGGRGFDGNAAFKDRGHAGVAAFPVMQKLAF